MWFCCDAGGDHDLSWVFMVLIKLAWILLSNTPHAAYPFNATRMGLVFFTRKKWLDMAQEPNMNWRDTTTPSTNQRNHKPKTTNNTSSSDITRASPSPRALELSQTLLRCCLGLSIELALPFAWTTHVMCCVLSFSSRLRRGKVVVYRKRKKI